MRPRRGLERRRGKVEAWKERKVGGRKNEDKIKRRMGQQGKGGKSVGKASEKKGRRKMSLMSSGRQMLLSSGAVEGKRGKGGGKASEKEDEKKVREKDDSEEEVVHASRQLPLQVEQPLHLHEVLKRNKCYKIS